MSENPGIVSVRILKLSVIVLLVGMPCFAIFFLASPVMQIGTIDPYVYTALIHDYPQALKRYGATYYANRVAFTVPARIAVAWLGDAGGHFLFQCCYLIAATASGFAIGRRYYSTSVGLAAAAWIAFNPWLIRALAWDYVEGAAVCYMLVAFSCFCAPRRHLGWFHLGGGVAFAFACNTNPFTIVMALALAPAWLILNIPYRFKRLFGLAAAALAGFIAGYALVIVVQYLELPELGFGRELTTLSVGMQQLGGGAAAWFQPLSTVLEEGRYYLLMPPLVAASVAILILGNLSAKIPASRFSIAALVFLSLTCAAYLFFHYYIHDSVLTVFSYDGYAFPATLFALTALLGETNERLSMRARQILCSLAVLAFAALWLTYEELRIALLDLSVGVLAALSGFLIVLMAGVKWPSARAAGAVAGAALAIVVFYYPAYDYDSPEVSPPSGDSEHLLLRANEYLYLPPRYQYGQLHDPVRNDAETEIYEAAVFLQRVVADTLPIAEGPVGFWYGDRPEDALFDSVQSIFLWGYSRIASPALPATHGAHLDAELRGQMANFRQIAILSRTLEQADDSLEALGADGAQVRLRARFAFPGRWFAYYTTIADYVPPTPPVGEQVAQIPFAALSAQNGGTITASGDGIDVHTAQQWAYSALAPLSEGGLPASELVLRVKLQVTQGQVGIAVATKDISAPFIAETGVPPSSLPRTVDIAIPNGEQAHFLIIRNWAPAEQSVAHLSDITVFRAKATSP